LNYYFRYADIYKSSVGVKLYKVGSIKCDGDSSHNIQGLEGSIKFNEIHIAFDFVQNMITIMSQVKSIVKTRISHLHLKCNNCEFRLAFLLLPFHQKCAKEGHPCIFRCRQVTFSWTVVEWFAEPPALFARISLAVCSTSGMWNFSEMDGCLVWLRSFMNWTTFGASVVDELGYGRTFYGCSALGILAQYVEAYGK